MICVNSFRPQESLPVYNIETIPDEILLLFLKFLRDPAEVGKCRRVCRRWNQVASDKGLWTTQLYLEKFGKDPQPHLTVREQFYAQMLKLYRLQKGFFALKPLEKDLRLIASSQSTMMIGKMLRHRGTTVEQSEGIALIDLQSGKTQKIDIPAEKILSSCADKFGNWLVMSNFDFNLIRIWNLTTGLEYATLQGKYFPAFQNPNSSERIWVSDSHETKLIDIQTSRALKRIPSSAVQFFDFDKGHCLIVSPQQDKYILQIWSYDDSLNTPILLHSTLPYDFNFLERDHHYVMCTNAFVFYDHKQRLVYRLDFQSKKLLKFSCHSDYCWLSKGPNNTIFLAHEKGYILLDETTLSSRLSKGVLSGNHVAFMKIIDNSHLLIGTWTNLQSETRKSGLQIWDLDTNDRILWPNSIENIEAQFTGPGDTILLHNSNGSLNLLELELASWLKNLAADFVEEEKSVAFFKYLHCEAVLQGRLTNDVYTVLCSKGINDTLNERFLALPEVYREGILNRFKNLIPKLYQADSLEAFLHRPECIEFRSQAIYQYISSLEKESVQKTLFAKLPPKQLFETYNLNAIAEKILSNQTVSLLEYAELIDIQPTIYINMLFKNAQELEKIGIDLKPICWCQKIEEGLFPRSDASICTLKPYIKMLIEYLKEDLAHSWKDRKFSSFLFDDLTAFFNLAPGSDFKVDSLRFTIFTFEQEELAKQKNLLKVYLSQLPEQTATCLSQGQTVSALQYLTLLGIKSCEGLSQAFSIRPEFLQQIGLSTSDDLKAIGLEYALLDQILRLQNSLQQCIGKAEPEWLEKFSDAPKILAEIIQKADKAIQFVEGHGLSLPNCDLTKYIEKRDTLKNVLNNFEKDQEDNRLPFLIYWIQTYQTEFNELSSLEIMRQRDLLRTYCLQPGILATWKTIDTHLTLSTFVKQSLPENVFTMGS